MAKRRIRSKRHSQRKKERRRDKIRWYSFGVLVVVALFIGLTHWSVVTINSIEVSTGSEVAENTVRGLTEDVLNEPWLGIVAQDNILLLPRNRLHMVLKDISPVVKTMDIDITGLRSIRVSLTEREPSAQLCTRKKRRGAGACKVIDKSGFVFSVSQSTATTAPSLTYTVNNLPKTGGRFMPKPVFSTVSSFVKTLPELGMYPRRVHIKKQGDADVVVYPQKDPNATSSSVTVKINIYDDLSQAFTNLQTVLEKNSLSTSTSSNVGVDNSGVSPFTFQYIDLRFENKVFYQ